jgi:hypothetical protein
VLPKASRQINQDEAVWCSNQSVANATDAGLFSIGVAAQAAGSDDATCRVRLSGVRW